MNLQPTQDRLIVQPREAEHVTKGGLHIPDISTEKPQEGKVLAVGKGKVNDRGELISVEVKVGDVVLYGRNSGVPIPDEYGTNLIMLRNEEILAIKKPVEAA